MYDNESQEMYLETILKIQKRKGSVRSIEIAEEMGFSRPSVSYSAIKPTSKNPESNFGGGVLIGQNRL